MRKLIALLLFWPFVSTLNRIPLGEGLFFIFPFVCFVFSIVPFNDRVSEGPSPCVLGMNVSSRDIKVSDILKWTNKARGYETAIAPFCSIRKVAGKSNSFWSDFMLTKKIGGKSRLILIRFCAQVEKWREKATLFDPISCSRRKLSGNHGPLWSVFKLKN